MIFLRCALGCQVILEMLRVKLHVSRLSIKEFIGVTSRGFCCFSSILRLNNPLVGLYTYTKCSCKTTRKISNEFCQGELTIIIVLVIFEDMASKLEKIGPIFFTLQPFPSLPSVATDGRKQFQCRKIVFGCILLGLFWLFLFRFRNNRIHGISISKRTVIHSENGILMAEMT